MKKNFTHKILAVGASLLMTTSAMLYLQGCGSDNNDPIVTGNNNPPPINNNTGGGVAAVTNLSLDGIVGTDYYFMHGATSTDQSKFLITVNENPGGPATANTSTLYMLDADSVANALPVLDTTGTNNTAAITGIGDGPGGATITFRSTWTQDDSKIMLAGADRFYVINADTLAVENGAEGDNTIGGQNHDALPTSDGKYALLTLRTKPYGDTNNDGEIQLYDVVNGAPIGNPVSVCNDCHGDQRDAILCGLDGKITLVPGTAPGYGGGETTPDTYTGTVYVAGHGAHFAKVDLVIDPSNTTDPIAVTLGRINISTAGDTDYKLHDARIDGTTMYWSTYMKDQNGYLHYGAFNLTTGVVTADNTYGYSCDVTGGSVYCASGQTSTHYMPITMTSPGYITLIPKATITTPPPTPEYCEVTGLTSVALATNVAMDPIAGNGDDYYFMHGSTNTARTKFLVTVNDNPGGEATVNSNTLYMLDAGSVAAAAPVLATSGVTTGTVSGDGSGPMGNTITFRSSWTRDDSKILLAGADRFYVINAETLAVENGATGDNTIGGQNHDALPTEDGKYAILTLRTKPYAAVVGSEANMDGEIQLYDIVNGAPLGNTVSVCNECHSDTRNAVLCGLDGVVEDDGDGTYSGTIYVAGHGAHFAKVNLNIDPSNTTDPISISTQRIQVKPSTAPASDYLLHDARLDGTMLYWSTYGKDASGNMHYGSVDLANGNAVVDHTIPYGIDGSGTDVAGGSVYCASGQTDTHHMPITMTTPGYITAIPK
jgi:hypothetical protein